MKSSSNKLWLYALALCLAACAPAALAQTVPEPSSSIIPMRGFHGDLSSTDDKFLSLDLNGDGKADMLSFRPGGGYAAPISLTGTAPSTTSAMWKAETRTTAFRAISPTTRTPSSRWT